MREKLKIFVLENSELFTIGGIIIGITGIILAIYFYTRSRRIKKLTYQVRSFNLVNESISKLPELDVRYKDCEIKNLTITKIAFWNSGNETITDRDLVNLDPLRISPSLGTEIFNIEIAGIVESSNNFNLIQNSNDWNIVFDYIDVDEGCVINVYHSGNESKDINVLGKIKGQGKIEINVGSRATLINDRIRYSNAPILIKETFILTEKIGWLVYLIAAIGTLIYSFQINNYWILLISLFCAFSTFVMFPKGQLPRKLQNIFNNDQ